MEIQRNWENLSRSDREILAQLGIKNTQSLLSRPGWAPGFTRSSVIYPITIHYEDISQDAYAAQALSYFEISWAEQIPNYGFTAPPPDGEGGSDNYDIYIQKFGGALGVTFQENPVPATPWQDFTSYIYIDPNLHGSSFDTTCTHEFNHACQMADDVRENIAFFENTSMWIEDMVFDDSNDYYWYISDFQKNPQRALDWSGGSSVYVYGGCLWPLFLVQHYASDDPHFMSAVWYQCRQNSGGNEPDNFDAISTVLASYTSDSFDDAYAELANWRYITGANDDGEHYEEGAAWGNRANPKIYPEHKHSSYPARNPDPLPQAPFKYGTNYVEFSNFDDPLFNISFSGDSATRWHVGIITVTQTGGTYTCSNMTVDADGEGSVTIPDATSYDRIMMVVCNLADGSYDVDTTPETRDNYTYLAYTGDTSSLPAIFTGKGAGPGNDAGVKGFDTSGAPISGYQFSAYAHQNYGVRISCGDVNDDGFDEVITGPGPGNDLAPEVKLFTPEGDPLSGGTFMAYGINRFGVNVAAGDINQDGRDEIITGPGPGAVFGPHVRAWVYADNTVTPLQNASVLAYGTKKFGTNVSAGDIDGDPRDEILTGAGPGAVFGPHVRAWNYGSGGITPDNRVSFMAYGTRKYGVNVSSGDLDGDGYGEILTGPGPSIFFGPHIRGWNYDGSSLNPMNTVSYFAYGNRKYGALVCTADIDGDLFDEIITGPGPGAMLGTNVTAWDYDNSHISRIDDLNFMAYSSEIKYGVHVAAGTFILN